MNFKISLFNQGTARDYKLGDFFSVGSSAENQLTLEGLCPKHFRIFKKGSYHHIQDVRSQTGTFVNTIKIESAILNEGDILRAGPYEFVFLENSSTYSLERMKSHNSAWNQTVLRIPSYAKSDLPVLVLGESGTGKEQISQQLHKLSSRKIFPSVTVNCSALTASLAESELFGHVKGAFTGATQDRKGAFEQARNGTLILDEIGAENLFGKGDMLFSNGKEIRRLQGFLI
jgi:transcriptional regulator with GAF, ATPase, and Fis domain